MKTLRFFGTFANNTCDFIYNDSHFNWFRLAWCVMLLLELTGHARRHVTCAVACLCSEEDAEMCQVLVL